MPVVKGTRRGPATYSR